MIHDRHHPRCAPAAARKKSGPTPSCGCRRTLGEASLRREARLKAERRGLAPVLAAALVALAPTVALIAAAPARAELSARDLQDVGAVEAYINRVTTFKADFTQIAPNGAVAKGTLWIARPGRLRVEYRPPSKLRVFATPQWLIVEDCKVKEPQYLPLDATPAGILIQERIALSGAYRVTDVRRENRWLTVRIVEAKAPEKGAISLVFEAKPLKLIGWTVVDQNGAPTQVSFEHVEAGIKLDPDLFGFISKCD